MTSIQKAPDGWLTIRKVARRLGISDPTVKKNAEKLRGEHPEWFQRYVTSDGHNQTHEHYAPQLIQYLTDEFIKIPLSQTNWRTVGFLRALLNADSNRIRKIANRFRNEHPEWFQVARSSRGNQYEYYATELCEIITNEVQVERQNNQLAPNDWRTSRNLEEELNLNRKIIRKLVDKYRDKHPEWFGNYYVPNIKKYVEYYSPELVSELRKHIE